MVADEILYPNLRYVDGRLDSNFDNIAGDIFDIHLRLTYNSAATLTSFDEDSFPILSVNQPIFKVYSGKYIDGVLSYRRAVGFLRCLHPADGVTEYTSIRGISNDATIGTSRMILVPLLNFDKTMLENFFIGPPRPLNIVSYRTILSTREY